MQDKPSNVIEITELPDWSREYKPFINWNPSRSLLASIRFYQRLERQSNPLAWLGRKWAVLCHRFWSVITGADIPLNSEIEGGLLLPHPNGVVIHPQAKIGPNCLIFQQVTIGIRGQGRPPILGTHVDVGAGAKILGAITIGDYAKIGANSVVMHDVPARKTAVGIPARVIE